ncbi:MAG TPA: DbpA RNA binding domain-containing protein [Gemmatimonadaceae bacterium]|nr:DbpA RNA binding domain-containing protein [Gemmatimonadaceae bacterium]
MSRGQNAVHVMPWDWAAAEPVLATLLDRIDTARAEPQLLVITADAENAAMAAAAIVRVSGNRDVRVVAATASPRAARLLRQFPSQVITGAPAELVALLQGSALKPESVRGVVFAWLDTILGTPDAQPLENLLSELPKEGARVVLATETTPELEALVERYARRARRVVESAAAADVAPLSADYVAVTDASRLVTLRRLLDALDMPRAVIYARHALVREHAAAIVRSLGYPADAVRVTGEASGDSSDPLVLAELPGSREELRRLVGATPRPIHALALPSQVASLRALLGGGAVAPITLLDAAERARGREAALRASLRDVLTSGDLRREVLALEPLLSDYDAIEVAAAALRLLEQQRPARATAAAGTQPMQRLFVNLGEKDGVRTQEIVNAITTEAGIPGSQVGKVEVRDTHSLVEVAASVAALVADKLTGSVVRGRRVQARVDAPRDAREGRPMRDAGPRGAGPRGGAPRGDRPVRSGPPRGAPRGDRPDRPARSFDKPPRKFDRGGAAGRPPRPRRDDA